MSQPPPFYSQPTFPTRTPPIRTFSQQSSSQPVASSSTPASNPHPRCVECGTRRMRLRAGQLVCKLGHVQQHFRVEANDEFEENTFQRKRRTLHRTRRNKKKRLSKRSHILSDTDTDFESDWSFYASETDKDWSSDDKHAYERSMKAKYWRTGTGTYDMYQGRFHRLQCLKLILRLQIRALQDVWKTKLPPQTESVARDLWAMVVSLFPVRHYPPHPLVAASFDWQSRFPLAAAQSGHGSSQPYHWNLEIANDKQRLKALYKREKKRRRKALQHDQNSQRHRRYNRGGRQDHDQVDDLDDLDELQDMIDDSYPFPSANPSYLDRLDQDDLLDPEDRLAALDPVFARERLQRKRQQQSHKSLASDSSGDTLEETDTAVTFSDFDELCSTDSDDDFFANNDGDDDDGNIGQEEFGARAKQKQTDSHSSKDQADPEAGYETTASITSSASGLSNRLKRKTRPSRSKRSTKSAVRKYNYALARFRKVNGLANIYTTISVLYLTLWMLQIPILWSDFTDLIASFRLPFLHALHRLPADLVRSINSDDVRFGRLDLESSPSPTRLHAHTVKIASILTNTYDIDFGHGNAPATLYRLIDHFRLPPTFYIAANRLLSFLDLPIHLDSLRIHVIETTQQTMQKDGDNTNPRDNTNKDNDHHQATAKARVDNRNDPDGTDDTEKEPPNQAQSDKMISNGTRPQHYLIPREHFMMAVLLVLIKMRYGLDGSQRAERVMHERYDDLDQPNPSDPGYLSAAPRFSDWLQSLQLREQQRKADPENVYDIDRTIDPLDMTDAHLDKYLDFLESNVILPNHPALYSWRKPTTRGDLLEFRRHLPTSPPPSVATPVQPSISTPPPSQIEIPLPPPSPSSSSSTPPPPPPGSFYHLYQFTTDPSGHLPPTISTQYLHLLDLANQLIGLAPIHSFSYPSISQLPYHHRATEFRFPLGLERQFGIQGYLEVLEKAILATLQNRRTLVHSLNRKHDSM